MTDYAERRQTIQEKLNALKKEMQNIGRDFFKTETEAIFTDFPNLRDFAWSQYTPYWNDGEPCCFSVHDWFTASYFNELPEFEGERDEVSYDSDLNARLSALINGIDEDVMRDLFGDHVTVLVSRDTVEVEECEHD